MVIPTLTTDQFQEIVWTFYRERGRHSLPWRQPIVQTGTEFNPYAILISEVMLQQTQVPRVIPKFLDFMKSFPTIHDLASAPLEDVLRSWNGLGYNRRAKFLWQAARIIEDKYHGVFPDDLQLLAELPGIGLPTAGAIVAYSFNRPTMFVETNIRTVFLYHFFTDRDRVADREVMDYVGRTLPKNEVREWYWALMDYGSYLKHQVGNIGRQSASYVKQAQFKGSNRQIRGTVLRLLSKQPSSEQAIARQITDRRLSEVLAQLSKEGLVHIRDGLFHLGA